jgi:hypothetical protein
VIALSLGENLGQRLKEMSVLTSGSHMSARKREGERTASGERERWAVGRFWFLGQIVSRGPFSFFLFISLFLFYFSFVNFAKRSQIDSNQI